jgi:hypothetical protein
LKTRRLLNTLLIWSLFISANLMAQQLADSACDTAFICGVVNHQRMYLDGSVETLQSTEPFGFKLEGRQLIPQQARTPLGDGTLPYDGLYLYQCDSKGRLAKSTSKGSYQFDASNSFYRVEYKDGQLLISAHVHHEYFELIAAECREL